MKRRNFLSMFCAAGLVPALPLPARAAPAAAGYSRYVYGLAVFQARTRATVSAADLMARLKLTTGQAEAIMAEMRTTGVIRGSVAGLAGSARVVQPHMAATAARAGRAFHGTLRRINHLLDMPETDDARRKSEAVDARPVLDGAEDGADSIKEVRKWTNSKS